MKFRTAISFILALSWVLIVSGSCSESVVYRPSGPGIGHGPPAHAPAHGYRRKQVAGVELVFDSEIGVYVVVGRSDHYYHEGYFYRCINGQWEISAQPDSGWAFVAEASLPSGLKIKSTSQKSQVSWGGKKLPPGKMK